MLKVSRCARILERLQELNLLSSRQPANFNDSTPKKSFAWPTDLVLERIKYLDIWKIQLRTLQEITELEQFLNYHNTSLKFLSVINIHLEGLLLRTNFRFEAPKENN